jgi:hypothetical protein
MTEKEIRIEYRETGDENERRGRADGEGLAGIFLSPSRSIN